MIVSVGYSQGRHQGPLRPFSPSLTAYPAPVFHVEQVLVRRAGGALREFGTADSPATGWVQVMGVPLLVVSFPVYCSTWNWPLESEGARRGFADAGVRTSPEWVPRRDPLRGRARARCRCGLRGGVPEGMSSARCSTWNTNRQVPTAVTRVGTLNVGVTRRLAR